MNEVTGGSDTAATGLADLGTAASWLENAEAPWRQIYRSWSRRDNAAFRAHMDRLLSSLRENDGEDPMRLWHLLSRASFVGQTENLLKYLGLDKPPPGQAVDWQAVCSKLFERLNGLLPHSEDPEAALLRATFSVFAYFECLVFWENSGIHDVGRAIGAEVHQLAPTHDGSADTVPGLISSAVAHLFESLSHQFDAIDTAMATCCSTLLESAARCAATRIELAAKDLDRIQSSNLMRDLDGEQAHTFEALVNLLRNDIDESLSYYQLLADVVAPATTAFIDNLSFRTADIAVAALLEDAIAKCTAFEKSPAGKRAVAGSETSAQRYALIEALRLLQGEKSTILADDANVIYVYPFGLPVNSVGFDPVRFALRKMFKTADPGTTREGPELGGFRTLIDDTPQTDVWLDESESDDLDYVGIRLLFPEYELDLITADGWHYRDLGLEIRIGGLGNHYVRILASTDTLRRRITDEEFTEDGRAWTPHDLDQFIRRGYYHFPGKPESADHAPTDRIVLRSRTTSTGIGPVGVTSTERGFASFTELAATLVKALVKFGATLGRDPEIYPTPERNIREDLGLVDTFLEHHRQVIVSISHLEAIDGKGAIRPIESQVEVADAASGNGSVGALTLLMPQRPIAQSPLEWLSYPAGAVAGSSNEMLSGRIRNEFIWCAGDVSAVIAPTLPNWMLMEVVEVMEFSASLLGVYARRHSWLRDEIRRSATSIRRPPISNTSVPATSGTGDGAISDQTISNFDTELMRLRAELDSARNTETDLDECLNHIRSLLDRARRFQLSRDLQGRMLVEYLTDLNGVTDLRDALEKTLDSTSSQQRLIRARVDLLQQQVSDLTDERNAAQNELWRAEEARRRERAALPIKVVGGVLAATALIDLFWWTNTSWNHETDHKWWIIEAVALGTFMLALAFGSVVAYRITNQSSSSISVKSSKGNTRMKDRDAKRASN